MMQNTTSAVILATVAGLASAQGGQPTVTTPTSLVECQPAQITVSGGTAPYFLSILPGGQAAATPLENLPTVEAAGSVTWNVDIAANTAVTVQVRDSTGALNYSQQVTVQAGSSNSCVGGNSSAPAASGASSASSAASSAASGASSAASSAASGASSAASSASSAASSALSSAASAGSSVRPSTASSASSVRPSGSSAAPSASASANGATTVSASVFGLAGAFVVALFA